ncbi:MAG: hypothetical protein JJT96_19710 [Opitutales bacterium]|nr:hypothetical protein [Opitutales bacterium]
MSIPRDYEVYLIGNFLGHAQVETTMIYLHVMEDQRERVRSPLDAVA